VRGEWGVEDGGEARRMTAGRARWGDGAASTAPRERQVEQRQGTGRGKIGAKKRERKVCDEIAYLGQPGCPLASIDQP
jgi:hypothetical protein